MPGQPQQDVAETWPRVVWFREAPMRWWSLAPLVGVIPVALVSTWVAGDPGTGVAAAVGYLAATLFLARRRNRRWIEQAASAERD